MTSATQHLRSASCGHSADPAHRARSLPDLLAHHARAHPDRPALGDGVRTFDYRTVDTAADRIAARLAAAGTRRGDRVALLGPRDARMLVLLYGVLRAGAAAVLADPDWSAADLARRLASVRVARVLATEGGLGGEVVDVEALPELPPVATEVRGEDLAYLSFTSGSSGEPKAVAVTHANAVHYARALAGRLDLTEADAPRAAHVTTLAADLGHTAWLLALATGGSVHLVPDREVRDPEAFWASLRRARVDVLKTTPSHLTALLEGRPADSPPLHTVLLGGEALPRPLAAALLDGGTTARLANHYGPTETTVGATCLLVTSARQLPAEEPTVPIGTAIGEVLLTVVDGDGRAVPDGSVGELLIGGRGVAAGYFGRPDETARGFVRRDGRLVYRTGDLCRRRPDGSLVFLGRVDRQVKVRGYRVDLAEVERAMDGHPGVARSAALLRETALGNQLIGVVRLLDGADGTGGLDGAGSLDGLRAHLRDRLPGYSVPQPILVLPRFPVGPNGKLDRQRLAELAAELVEARAESGDTGSDGTEPDDTGVNGGAGSGPAGEIARFWAGALGLPAVGPRADVLGLGGDSILAMRTIALLRRSGLRVAYEDFYRYPTAEGLAAVAVPVAPSVPAPRGSTSGRRLAPAQRWLYRQRTVRDLRHWNQSVLLRCRTAVDPEALSAAVAAVLERHPALRRPVTPDGCGEVRAVAELDPVSFSRIPRAAGEIADTVAGVCTELHRSLDPSAGRLLRAHLFTGPPGTDDRLALIAHHLVVDGLSWRILLDDLAHAYRAVLDRKPVDLPPTADFYAWAAVSSSDAAEPVAGDAAVGEAGEVGEIGEVEEPAALSWALDPDATARLIARHGAGAGLEAVLLAAFAEAVTGDGGRPRLAVEVETHGRDAVGDPGEFLDTVGWFTAVKHVELDAGATPDTVARRLREAPVRPMDGPGGRPAVGFNFLGTFRLPEEPALDWTVAAEQAGTARCTGGDPLYELRLTARVVEQRLVADLVYGRPGLSHPAAERITGRFARAVAAEARAEVVGRTDARADAEAPEAAPPVRAPLSTSGQLLHPGVAPTARATVREPARVLLTGATGYLGRHLLEAFLARGAEVTCLVRAADDDEALKRLGTGAAGAVRPARALAGDIDRDGLGLSPAALEHARGAHLVVHAAADVRLVASPDELERTNHTAVRRLLDWVGEHAPDARVHHVSTLAVSGGVDGPPRRFSEADLEIGQHFRTPYERTKYRAEQAVRAWAARGHAAYLHRSGHIAAHSRTGAFQANAGDNRIYQLLRGYLLAGAAPSRPGTAFAFSYVDTVAAGIAAIALDPYAAPGAYHVETPHAVPHDELVRWLAGHGHAVRLTDEAAFAAALARAERRHPTAARVAAAWAAQEERRVLVDSSYTTAVLDRLGVRFAAPTPRWWSAALTWAAEAGYLPPAGPTPLTRDDTRDDVRDGAGHDPRDDIREGRTNP